MHMNKWHLIYTKANLEKRTAEQLRDLHIDTLLPLTTEVRQWHDRRKVLKRPAYPSYVFVKVCNIRDYIKIMEVNSVLSFVKVGSDKIADIPDHTINNIRILVENDCDVLLSTNRIKPSEQVVINSGPLTGLTGEIVNINKSNKFIVRVNFLYRDLMIPLPLEAITKL